MYRVASNVMAPTVRGDVSRKWTQMRFEFKMTARDGAGDEAGGKLSIPRKVDPLQC
jgi:hypothetical protein